MFNDLTRLIFHSYLSSIEVLESEIDSSQGINKSDSLFHDQISTLSLESLVWLLLADNDNITSFHPGKLVSLSMEFIFVFVRGAFVDFNIDDFLFFDNFFAITVLAFVLVVYNLAFSTAIIARTLRLRVHSRSKLDQLRDHTLSSASRASLDCSFFSSFSITFLTDSFSVYSDLS
jgi:hypothetical protein